MSPDVQPPFKKPDVTKDILSTDSKVLSRVAEQTPIISHSEKAQFEKVATPSTLYKSPNKTSKSPNFFKDGSKEVVERWKKEYMEKKVRKVLQANGIRNCKRSAFEKLCKLSYLNLKSEVEGLISKSRINHQMNELVNRKAVNFNQRTQVTSMSTLSGYQYPVRDLKVLRFISSSNPGEELFWRLKEKNEELMPIPRPRPLKQAKKITDMSLEEKQRN